MLAPCILIFVQRDGYLDVYLQVSFYMVGQKKGLKLQYSIHIFVWMRGKFKSNLKICHKQNVEFSQYKINTSSRE